MLRLSTGGLDVGCLNARRIGWRLAVKDPSESLVELVDSVGSAHHLKGNVMYSSLSS